LLLPARWTRRLRHFHRFHRQALATPGVELVHSVGDSPVVSKCANPACSAPFRYLHEGKLFRMEMNPDGAVDTLHVVAPSGKPAKHTEFFWLCDECAIRMTLAFEKGGGIKTRPLTRALRAAS